MECCKKYNICLLDGVEWKFILHNILIAYSTPVNVLSSIQPPLMIMCPIEYLSPCAVQSLLDDAGLADVSSAAEAVKLAVEQEQFEKATELWSVLETVVEQVGTVRVSHAEP